VPSSPQGYLHPLLDALQANAGHTWTPGTYELCGPKINGNPERLERHDLFSHDRAEVEQTLSNVPLVGGGLFERIKFYMTRSVASYGWEGIVWHHPDGRMAKLKVRDF